MSVYRNEKMVTNIPQYEIMDKSLTNENFPSVLFSGTRNSFCVGIVDMVNSTKISASLNYDKFSKYYSFFLNTMSEIAKKCNAKIVKNIGDSLLFYFPNSLNVSNSPHECLTCCLALVEYHSTLNEILRKQDLPKLDYRVSADFGQIMIANSENSHQEDIFGSPVNMVSKINRNAKPNQVVIGGDLHELVKKFTQFSFKQVQGCNIGLKNAYPSYIVDFKKGFSLNQKKRKKNLTLNYIQLDQ